MQEPFKRCQGSPDTVASDSVGDDPPADSIISSSGTREPTAVALPCGHRPANPCTASEVDSLTTDDGHLVFCNRSDFSSAVAVHRNFGPHVRWTCVTRFATYVLLGVILIVCAYLPQCGHGDDLYDEAIDEIRATRSRAPKHRHVCLACDANSSLDGLANVEGYDEVVGPVIHHLTEKGPRTHKRARALTGVCLEWQMEACNTFPHRGPRHDGFQNGSFSPELRDSWTYSSYPKQCEETDGLHLRLPHP